MRRRRLLATVLLVPAASVLRHSGTVQFDPATRRVRHPATPPRRDTP